MTKPGPLPASLLNERDRESGVALLCLLRASVPRDVAGQFSHIPFHIGETGLLSVLEHLGAGLVAS